MHRAPGPCLAQQRVRLCALLFSPPAGHESLEGSDWLVGCFWSSWLGRVLTLTFLYQRLFDTTQNFTVW